MATETPVILNPGAGGDHVAAILDSSSNKHQQIILEFYTGSGDPQLVSSSAPLPTNIIAALPTGGNTIGAVTQSGTWLTTINAALPAGGNTIGAIVGSVASGVVDSGAPVKTGGIYHAAPITLADGNRGDTQLDVNGYLKVNIVAGAAAGGTSSNFASAFPGAGTAVGATDGTNMRPLNVDGSGNLKVNVAAGAVPALADNNLFTSGATQGLPAFGVYNDGIGALTTGNAGAFRLTASRQLMVAPQANQIGGWTPKHLLATASNNATSIKATPGCLGYVVAFNLSATPVYVKFYDKASAPAPATDSALMVYSGMIPGNAAGAGFVLPIPAGMQFSTGIGMAVVSGIADADNSNAPATSVLINYGYN